MVPMQRLTWVSGSFSAHVLRARLCSEGIDAELRGPVDGPYALTVGAMARVDVYVPADQMEDAHRRPAVAARWLTCSDKATGPWTHGSCTLDYFVLCSKVLVLCGNYR